MSTNHGRVELPTSVTCRGTPDKGASGLHVGGVGGVVGGEVGVELIDVLVSLAEPTVAD